MTDVCTDEPLTVSELIKMLEELESPDLPVLTEGCAQCLNSAAGVQIEGDFVLITDWRRKL